MRFPPAIAIAEQRLIDAGGEAFASAGVPATITT